MSSGLIIVITVFIMGCIILYRRYKQKTKESRNRLENNLHRIGWPVDFHKCRNHMEILKLKHLLPYLSGFPNMSPGDANNSEIYTVYKKGVIEKESAVYLLDTNIRYMGWPSLEGSSLGREAILRIAFLPGGIRSLPEGGIDIFPKLKEIGERSDISSYYTPPAVNAVEDFNKHFMLMPRNQKAKFKKIYLNPNIQSLALDFRKKYEFLWERNPYEGELLFPFFSIWEEGIAVRTSQTVYKEDLAALVKLGEKLVIVANKRDFVWCGS